MPAGLCENPRVDRFVTFLPAQEPSPVAGDLHIVVAASIRDIGRKRRGSQLFASIIIPTHNAVHRLLYTLASLNLQYAPFEEFEVIVVDNASTDGLKERIRQFESNYPLRYYRTVTPVPVPQVINAGIAKAKGQIVILLNENMIVPRHFVGCHMQAHARKERLVVVGGETKRMYSVYYPSFNESQQQECQSWLEQYPQIKRPHTSSEIVPLLTENIIASGILPVIGLERPLDSKREAILHRYGHQLERYPHLWALFRTEHASIERKAFAQIGLFRKGRLTMRQVERDMGRRLLHAGYHFEVADKIILMQQEAPCVPESKKQGSGIIRS
ncbi:glycosyltransferase family A protein [Brevibacillus migulae]|uniref:glycosyltransferase family A protein n=1 Tax=Brevibacillus migulae TaxID=1644114 RepID=UPI00142FB758|nr:glycosyltransferase family 2 protein [Brevibacillus migulae]